MGNASHVEHAEQVPPSKTAVKIAPVQDIKITIACVDSGLCSAKECSYADRAALGDPLPI